MSSRPTKTSSTTCGASAACRATSIPSIPASTIRWSASAGRVRRRACPTVGHVLPIMKNALTAWQTGPWFLRDERCYLIPGDSPLGYRLPLDSQPGKATDPYVNPPDPEMAQARWPATPPGGGERRQRPDAGARARRGQGRPGQPGDARLQGVRRLDHPPGHVRRAARRQALHLHAAAEAGGLPRSRRRHRGHRRRMRCRWSWKATSRRPTRA
jgi:hypothetical protein